MTYQELVHRMDRVEEDTAITWLQPSYRREVDESNTHVYKASKKYPGRIIGFGWADLNFKVKIVKLCKLLSVHCRVDQYHQTHPYQIEKIAKQFPGAKVLCVHTGGAGFQDLSRAATEVALKNPNTN